MRNLPKLDSKYLNREDKMSLFLDIRHSYDNFLFDNNYDEKLLDEEQKFIYSFYIKCKPDLDVRNKFFEKNYFEENEKFFKKFGQERIVPFMKVFAEWYEYFFDENREILSEQKREEYIEKLEEIEDFYYKALEVREEDFPKFLDYIIENIENYVEIV